MIKNNINFKKIKKNKKNSDILFNLLSKRSFKISHKKMPSIKDHYKFVKNSKYRYWYFIILNEEYIGTFYIKNDNSVGLNINGYYTQNLIKNIISYIKENFKPLPEIKSERINSFFYNVSPENKKLIKVLKKLKFKNIQLTFIG